MANFLNDGSLIGFWPFNEPSGALLFKNYSPARSRAPSGISFDFHVGTAFATAATQTTPQMKSLWPGTSEVYNPGSGTVNKGYMAQGYWKLGANSSPYSHHLILGNGNSWVREQTLAPNVAHSGFTVGMWVYPNSDGYSNLTRANDIGAAQGWETECVRAHGLIGQHSYNAASNAGGWHFGVSGLLDRAAQNNFTYLASKQLCAYIGQEGNGTTANTSLRCPIESGVYTHIAFTYRFVNGSTLDELVLYKNGRVAASGVASFTAGANSFTMNNATLIAKAFGIGNSDDASAVLNGFSGTAGWNHLMSGVYFFRRILHEGEMLDLHNGQTLQPLEENIKLPARVELTDPQLLAHYPFRSVGFPDATKNHRPLVGPIDEGPVTDLIPVPGPFKGGAVFEVASNTEFLVTTSGLINDMLSGRSWTIGVVAAPVTNAGRDNNMIFSMGSVSTATTGGPTGGTVSTSTFGMALTEFTTAPNRMRFSVYPLGDVTAAVMDFDFASSGLLTSLFSHYAIAYDDSTKGVAIYLDGAFQGSGTLQHSLTDQLVRLAGSGYPLMFMNGITNAITDTVAHGVFTGGGQYLALGPITIVGRALVEPEIAYIAQSGIDTTPLWRTIYDPRLLGYWPCSDYQEGDVIVEDRARAWEIFPGNLSRGETNMKWDTFIANIRTDQFAARPAVPELASYGPLGITSGIFAVHGLSPGTAVVTDAGAAATSIANLSSRYKPYNEQSTLAPQNVLGEFILSYEVTPSGDIPLTPLGLTADATKFEFNSTLSVYGNYGITSTNGEVRSFLTTVDAAQGSGVTLVFASRTGAFATPANYRPLISGVLPYGVPSKVLLHSKFESPYNAQSDTVGTTPITLTLWINGTIASRRTGSATSLLIASPNVPNGGSDTHLLEFGGEAGRDNVTAQVTRDAGLGEIFMREIFLMRGTFDVGEVQALAVSGIQTPTITGFTPTLPKTQVTIADQDLQGYWRFNGFDGGGSGTRDLSIMGHHLDPLSERKNRQNSSTIASRSFKFIPGPLKNSSLGVRCSGLTYNGSTAGSANITPPFAVSGVAFDSPQDGFSIGFLYARRATMGASTAETMLAYGQLPATVTSAVIDFNHGWSIFNDDTNNIKMLLSLGGNSFMSNTSSAAQSGQIVCGTYNADSIYEDLTRNDNYRWGNPKSPRFDYLNHYCWTYDPTAKELICYINGQEIDRKATKFAIDSMNGGPASGLNPIIPVNPASRMITFFSHQRSGPWDFAGADTNDENSILTDVFYFTRPLTGNEVRYIAENGIDDSVRVTTSGIIGGYITGSDLGSGMIGGYNRGLDTVSGIIGGFDFGADAASGIIGGYISGVTFFTAAPSGSIGGYITGYDLGSGMIGGFISGAAGASGLIGGFILGGLLASMQFDGSFTVQAFAAKDFDAQLVLRKTTTADFDAKLVIFQAEQGPIVDIIIPGTIVSGVTPPFNQYFIGAASGTQGKSIVQTRWTFGDLTSTVSVPASGGIYYPVQHYYAGSGFFIAKFEAIDSNGIHGSATRIINAAQGIDPVIASLSGVPRSGNAALIVDFTNTVDILPPGVSITASLLNFDDGLSTITFNPTHVYSEPGTYKPIWIVRDSRGVIWCDSLEAGNDFLKEQ